MKRIMIAGTHNSSDRGVIACALVQEFISRKINVTAFKGGPGCLDTSFFKEVMGIPAYNIDSYLMTKNTINYLLDKNGGELALISGTNGYYDGYCFTRTASSCELSLWTDTPVVLVVDAHGIGAGVGAVIKGFLEYGRNNIKGVIFDNIEAGMYPFMKQECEKLGIKAFGYFKTNDLRVIQNLSLVTETEIDDMREQLKKLAKRAEETIDIEEILLTASEAPELSYEFKAPKRIADVRIAYAKDRVFSLYYGENLQLLKELGAELVPFSPISDSHLPEDIDGLIIGDGYTSIYAKVLADNKSMLASVKNAVVSGIPCIAECGGFMYLHKHMTDITGAKYNMAGVIDGSCSISETHQRYFYLTMKALNDNLLCEKGAKIASYELNSYESSAPGTGFEVERDGWEMKRVNTSKSLYAGFPHINFYSNIDFARNFIKACSKRGSQCK